MAITYPDLPIVEKRDEIIAAVAAHPVVIVAGETGSGKTTQLGKMMLAMGRGENGWIGHTQPRRLAASAVAHKIAEELDSTLGDKVGYKVRFSDKTSPHTKIKLMTDGILLAETQQDRLLKRYDTLIIDEAHERSLNIDFLLGVIKNILKKRDDLKIIVTSATIDVEKFSRFFSDAPIIEVSGRTYPVTVHYAEEASTHDLAEDIYRTLQEIDNIGMGDVLVFLSGEREIREVNAYLRNRLQHILLIPLYARLSAKEQHKVFEVKGGVRRIILATNVAETSLTVPNIRFVIDPGMARISRYSYRSQIQCLPIEPISQASANQRKGRCGRVSAGICYRLYTEADFIQRPLYTEPEILRTNLAQVLLQMLSLGLGDPKSFPFIDPPDNRYIEHGLKVLDQLGAINAKRRLTANGRTMARFPIEPRLARMILGAVSYQCLTEVLIIVSALSIQSPYDKAHPEFENKQSDFLSLLQLWQKFHQAKHELSNRQFKGWCEEHEVNFLRLLEWQDVHEQLNALCHQMKFQFNQVEADYASVHKALLSGLIPFIGIKDEKNNYIGPRNLKFRLFFSSSVNAKPPKWVMCFDFVQTQQVFSRLNAAIEPGWVEEVAPHLVKKTYFEPHWVPEKGFVSAYQKVILLGLEVVPKRRVNYSKIDPLICHELFVMHALVGEETRTRFSFLEKNNAMMAQIRKLEDRFRRRDLLVEKSVLAEFYAKKLPISVNNIPALQAWLKTHDESELYFHEDFLLAKPIDESSSAFPQYLKYSNEKIPLKYHFSPGQQVDGVTLQLTVMQARKFHDADFSGMVNGLLEEKIYAFLKSLPKAARQNLSPLQSYASAIFEVARDNQNNLIDLIIEKIKKMTGMNLQASWFDTSKVPDYLFYRFAIIDESHTTLATGRDLTSVLEAVKQNHPDQFESQLQLKTGITQWEMGDLPKREVEFHIGLVDKGDSVAIQRFEYAWQSDAQHAIGVARLVILNLPEVKKYLLKEMPYKKELKPYIDAIILASIKHIVLSEAEVRSQAVFEPVRMKAKKEAPQVTFTLAKHLYTALALQKMMRTPSDNVKAWMTNLVASDFILNTPYQYLLRYPIYFKTLEVRNLKPNVAHEKVLNQLIKHYQQALKALPLAKQGIEAVVDYRYMLEEFQVSLYAQQLGTLMPISIKRLQKQWDKVLAS